MQDQWVVLGAALGLKNAGHRLWIKAVGPQAVDRLRGDADQPAPADDLRRLRQVLFCQILRFHVILPRSSL